MHLADRDHLGGTPEVDYIVVAIKRFMYHRPIAADA
jgi:hypothetical protein